MYSCTYGSLRNVINLGNSIIGVSILAMPYCFQKCGILLSLLLIVLSGVLVRTACYLLLKGAIMARRRNFECLAFHAMGSTGKLAVEIGVIGFLIGVCIAFFVVIGDLGPPLASEYFMIENTSNLRAEVLVFLGAFVALPLGLLRKVDSLTSLSFLSIAFYVCLVLKIFTEASSKLVAEDWFYEVNWWKSEGFLPCLPIFSMALSCQTQLFEFFDTLSEPTVKRMTSVVNGAVCLCSSVYISVGLFGYIACHDKEITGNILVNMTPSLMTEFIKLGFIVTVVISFPLCLFPCRTSLHSLLFKQGLGHHDIAVNFIPDHRFRVLTISLVVITVGISIMLPSIEFVLSIIGSTIGTTICFIFPAVIFIRDIDKNATEKRIAQGVLFAGVFILVACTYSTLQERTVSRPITISHKEPLIHPHELPIQHFTSILVVSESPPLPPIPSKEVFQNVDKGRLLETSIQNKDKELSVVKGQNEQRQEPPQPQAPDIKMEKNEQNDDIDPQALQKEDKEIQKESLNGITPLKASDTALKEKQEQLLLQLQEQQKEQKIILEQQIQVLEELKLHKEIHDEAIRENSMKKSSEQGKLTNKENNSEAILEGNLNMKSASKVNKHAESKYNKQRDVSMKNQNIQKDIPLKERNIQEGKMQNIQPLLPEKPVALNEKGIKHEDPEIKNRNIPISIPQDTKPLAHQNQEKYQKELYNDVYNQEGTVRNHNLSVVRLNPNFPELNKENTPSHKSLSVKTRLQNDKNKLLPNEVKPYQSLDLQEEIPNSHINGNEPKNLISQSQHNHTTAVSQNGEIVHMDNGKREMR